MTETTLWLTTAAVLTAMTLSVNATLFTVLVSTLLVVLLTLASTRPDVPLTASAASARLLSIENPKHVAPEESAAGPQDAARGTEDTTCDEGIIPRVRPDVLHHRRSSASLQTIAQDFYHTNLT